MTLAELRATLREDFERDEFAWDRTTITIFRLGQWANAGGRRHRHPAWFLWKVIDILYLRLLIGAELPHSVQIGPGLVLRHAGRGVIMHSNVRIGRDARIYHRVTIGVGDFGGPPTLGDGVYVGCGASILGEIEVGDRARIGAGAVVVRDVPADTVAVGVPARPPVRRDADADAGRTD
jgi:serine acetyltransferase